MILIKNKPTSPGRRHSSKIKNLYISKKNILKKKLIKIINKTGGRNNIGKITVRHIGGRHKRYYRIIDFKRNKYDIYGKVVSIEYDPNRSSNIALILYKDGEYRYILAPKNINIGDKVLSSNNDIPINVGNSLLIKNISIGSIIHNIELYPGKGAKISRSAGSYSKLLSKQDKYAILKLKSGEIRKISLNCMATIGEVGNSEHMLVKLGKAGISRRLGIRPTVRGTAMNPVDHPHGGGEGKNFGKHPVSPWGLKTKGKKTRKNKLTNKFIISRKKK